MVGAMRPGSVIVDLAAEAGGNCELTRAGETVRAGGVEVIGAVNLPATLPFHASQLYGRNLATVAATLWKDGRLDRGDEIAAAMRLVDQGKVLA
jgi:NAD(P) transhydrogenase subunit alpha